MKTQINNQYTVTIFPCISLSRNIEPFAFIFRYKDAVFLSPHKFVGGPGTPGRYITQELLLLQCLLAKIRETPVKFHGFLRQIMSLFRKL